MRRYHRYVLLVPALLAGFSMSAPLCADGPRDNQPENVRRVPRLGIEVPAEQQMAIEAGLASLKVLLDRIAKSEDAAMRERLPDVEIFYKAAHDALKHQEFFKASEIDDALRLLQLGTDRAKSLLQDEENSPSDDWLERPASGLTVRGYRSRIDHSVQPYGLVVPASYTHRSAQGYRLDVWFHGRGETMSENGFITERLNSKGVFAPKDTIVLHPYGRYSNAFKFAGETDVLEAIQHVRENYNIDEDRISVRGFSMGGAACWQFAVHYADRWFAANPGAGFSETPEFLKFFQKESLEPTWFEEKLWRMYDCNLWAKNLLHCPTVAYSGEDDIQKQAADIMDSALDAIDIKLVHIIGPDTGHRYHPDAVAEVDRRLDALAVRGRDSLPMRVDFVTYTLKYNRMHWVTVDALEEHWEPATVTAEINPTEPQILITARNVQQLTLEIPPGAWPHPLASPVKVFVNGKGGDVVQPMSDRSLQLTLSQRGDDWVPQSLPKVLRKVHNLQGPIDDALMDSFIFVRPTGKALHVPVERWVEDELERAIEHWRRHFRGEARVKDDVDVTEQDIASANLILWGDPGSNKLIKDIAIRFPISWDGDAIDLGSAAFAAKDHALIAIYPNPLNPRRYIVLNSSFTFREFAYLNNARQVPKLPDWAVVDIRTPPNSLWPGKIVAADFFDESWRVK